jgi:hypothetical protein
MVRDGETSDSGKEIFDNISRIFEAGEINSYKLLIDSENQKVMLLDTDTVDMALVDFEEANNWLSEDGDDIIGRIDEFYGNLIQGVED